MTRLNKETSSSRLTNPLRSLSQASIKHNTRRFSVNFRKKSQNLEPPPTKPHRTSFSDKIPIRYDNEPKATLAVEETFTDDLPKQVKVLELLSSPKPFKRPFIRRRTSSLDVGHTKAYYNEIASETEIVTPTLDKRQRLNALRNRFKRLDSITDEDYVTYEGLNVWDCCGIFRFDY